MKNILFLLKIIDSDFRLNYAKIYVFLKFGIFLCWGCLIASFVTGAFESRLENRISYNQLNQEYKLNLLNLQDDLNNQKEFYLSISSFIENYYTSKVSSLVSKIDYLEKLNRASLRCLNYLKTFNLTEENQNKIAQFENKIFQFQKNKDKFIEHLTDEKKLEIKNQIHSQELLDVASDIFSLVNDETNKLDKEIAEYDEEIRYYNNLSSMTFVLTFIVQLFIFIVIQSFEVSVERRRIKNE